MEVGDGRPWYPPAGQVYRVLIVAFILTFVAGALLAHFIGHAGALTAYLLFVLMPPLLVVDRAGSEFRRVLKLHRIGLSLAVVCLAMALPLGLLMSEVDILMKRMAPMPEFWRVMREQAFTWRNATDFVFLALWTVLAGPICEEVLFRGYALSGFHARHGAGRAVLLTSILFGVFHLDPWLFAPTLIIGALLGFLVVRTGSIYPAMLVHAGNNLLSVAGLSIRRLRNVGWLHESLLPPHVLIVCLVALGAAVGWILRTYRPPAGQEIAGQAARGRAEP